MSSLDVYKRQAYEAEHPNVTLEWELTSSSTGSDLLKSKLAADELPDVFDVNYGESTVQWAPHLLNVDDLVEPLKAVSYTHLVRLS